MMIQHPMKMSYLFTSSGMFGFLAGMTFISTFSLMSMYQSLLPFKSDAVLRNSMPQPSRFRELSTTREKSNQNHPNIEAFEDTSEEGETVQEPPNLDFFVAGFPKCGTTSLLYSFAKHNETSISSKEFCSLNAGPVDEALSGLNSELQSLPSKGDHTQFGIKCPMGVRLVRGIQRLSKEFNSTKLIVGVRHPVKFFQSFYNYRVTEMYDNNERIEVPSPMSLIGNKGWRDVSTDLARFELSLMQLAKVDLTTKELQEMAARGLTLAPSPFKMFLYTIDQLEDKDEDRALRFRQDMQQFLGLNSPIDPFQHENVNTFVGETRHPETIDICDPKHSQVRKVLINRGEKTRRWITDKFVKSNEVIAGDESHFLELIEEWGKDPCQSTS